MVQKNYQQRKCPKRPGEPLRQEIPKKGGLQVEPRGVEQHEWQLLGGSSGANHFVGHRFFPSWLQPDQVHQSESLYSKPMAIRWTPSPTQRPPRSGQLSSRDG